MQCNRKFLEHKIILFPETQSSASDTLRRISRATTTAVGDIDETEQELQGLSKELTPQFSHKIVVAIDFGTTYR